METRTYDSNARCNNADELFDHREGIEQCRAAWMEGQLDVALMDYIKELDSHCGSDMERGSGW